MGTCFSFYGLCDARTNPELEHRRRRVLLTEHESLSPCLNTWCISAVNTTLDLDRRPSFSCLVITVGPFDPPSFKYGAPLSSGIILDQGVCAVLKVSMWWLSTVTNGYQTQRLDNMVYVYVYAHSSLPMRCLLVTSTCRFALFEVVSGRAVRK